jgi:uncharacterized membrane protein YhiD involved in acid resistance
MLSDADALVRIAVALVFGAIAGIERQWHHKNAGIKTNTLVGVGACAFAIVTIRGLGPGLSIGQIAAGVVSGIGFIGAGVIMRQGGSVQGINTAANIWATASMGLAVGGGHFILGAVILGAILSIQVVINRAAMLIDSLAPKHVSGRYLLSIEGDSSAIAAADALLAGLNAPSQRRESRVAGAAHHIVEEFAKSDPDTMREIEQQLSSVSGITSVAWEKAEEGHEHGTL